MFVTTSQKNIWTDFDVLSKVGNDANDNCLQDVADYHLDLEFFLGGLGEGGGTVLRFSH